MKANCEISLIILLLLTMSSCSHGITRSSSPPNPPRSSTPAQPDRPLIPSHPPQNYSEIRAKLEAERRALFSSYERARTLSEKSEVLNRARETMTRSVYAEIFPVWYGTPWDFNGTSEIPGQGKIACGYFVSTVLRDAGVKVQRVKLAQQASENIILSLTTDANIKRFRQKPIGDFIQAVEDWGPGLYIVGLDIHVGFIVNHDGQVYFIHSSYIEPYRVIKETAIESRILARSHYRVLGKISADDQFIEKWLRGDEIATRL